METQPNNTRQVLTISYKEIVKHLKCPGINFETIVKENYVEYILFCNFHLSRIGKEIVFRLVED